MRFGSDRKGSDRRENGWLRAKTVPSRLRVLERAKGEEMRMRENAKNERRGCAISDLWMYV